MVGRKAKESPPLTDIELETVEEATLLDYIVREEKEVIETATKIAKEYEKKKYLLEEVLEELKGYWWYTVIPEKEVEEEEEE